ncbi:MAG TPA: hypothetical protein VHF47_05135 [Acidimicrobiales bacterium]|nr:hypothetical protein [Acidimicrobiales bacterium]
MNLRKPLGAALLAITVIGTPSVALAQTGDYVGAEVEVRGVELERAPAPVSVRGAQESDSGALPLTGGDLVGMALFGAGAVAFGSVLLRRGRTEAITA